MKKKNSKFPDEKEIVETQTIKPERKKGGKGKTEVKDMVENEDGVWEESKNLEEFQRPETVQLKEIGQYVEGLYEGVQPVEYKKTGGVGYLMLLRQKNGGLKAISAGYDIRRWLLESGFDKHFGEYVRITLDKFIDTSGGQLAAMKQYRFGYTQNMAAKLLIGTKMNLAGTLALQDGVKLLSAAENTPKNELGF